jgi:predicted permease
MFFDVIVTITIPLLAVIALGYLGCRMFPIDPRALGQLLINVVAPGAFVYFLLSNPAPISSVGFAGAFATGRFLVLYLVGWALIAVFSRDRVLRRAFGLAVAFPNSGNFGIPLVQLAFGEDWLLHQSVITMIHSIMIVVAVPLVLPLGKLGVLESLRSAFKTPLLPSVLAGLVIKALGIEMPQVVMAPLKLLAAGLTPLALLTLGAQIAHVPRVFNIRPVIGIVALRVFAAPFLSALALMLFSVDEATRNYLIVNSCVPVGILLAVLLAEHAEVSRMITLSVAASTAVAPFAVTLVISMLPMF